jgi:hypothetical protein
MHSYFLASDISNSLGCLRVKRRLPSFNWHKMWFQSMPQKSCQAAAPRLWTQKIPKSKQDRSVYILKVKECADFDEKLSKKERRLGYSECLRWKRELSHDKLLHPSGRTPNSSSSTSNTKILPEYSNLWVIYAGGLWGWLRHWLERLVDG